MFVLNNCLSFWLGFWQTNSSTNQLFLHILLWKKVTYLNRGVTYSWHRLVIHTFTVQWLETCVHNDACLNLACGEHDHGTEQTGNAFGKHERRQRECQLACRRLTLHTVKQQRMTGCCTENDTQENEIRRTAQRPRFSCFSSPRTTRKPCCLSITAGFPGNRLLGCTTKKKKTNLRPSQLAAYPWQRNATRRHY